MQKDFEPIVERQFHYFTNGAEGIQHNGQRDITWIRISKASFAKGFRLEHIGKLLHARIHEVFGNIVDKVQVTLITDEAQMEEVLEEARIAYRERNERIASLTDESVDTFYSCLLCQSFAPNHVCVVNPERVGLCGAYNWLDCKASFEINPTGPNQPVPKGAVVDPVKGEFTGPNEFVYTHSNQTVDRVTFYSIMEAPMTSCGCFECIMVLVPEANGFMIVSREDPSMTPCGMTFSTLAGTAGGGLQTPGMMGFGKYYLTSNKFISADGGIAAHRLDEQQPQGEHARGSRAGVRARRRARASRPDRRRDRRHDGRGAAPAPRREGASGVGDGSTLLTGPRRPGVS